MAGPEKGGPLAAAAFLVALSYTDDVLSPDVDWLRDTARRAQARHGELLAVLAAMSGPLFELGELQAPTSPEAEAAAMELDRLAGVADDHLTALREYVDAVTDPGKPFCGACGFSLTAVAEGPWPHWSWTPETGRRPMDADHEPVIRFEPPERPDWDQIENDGPATTPPATEGRDS